MFKTHGFIMFTKGGESSILFTALYKTLLLYKSLNVEPVYSVYIYIVGIIPENSCCYFLFLLIQTLDKYLNQKIVYLKKYDQYP